MQDVIQNDEATRKLWASYLLRKIEDAMFPFKIPAGKDRNNLHGIPSIKQQHLNFLSGKNKLPPLKAEHINNRGDSVVFLERSHFDDIVEDIGYGSAFVNRTFKLVQEAVTHHNILYKKHYDERKRDFKRKKAIINAIQSKEQEK